MSKMTSSKPYLVRAFYEWINDNKMVPHVVINANLPGVRVPKQYIENGHIVLNISYTACDKLLIDNSFISFQASFGGVIQEIMAPIKAVQAIYAKETGKGMIFSEEDDDGGDDLPPTEPTPSSPTDSSNKDIGGKDKKKSHLRVIK